MDMNKYRVSSWTRYGRMTSFVLAILLVTLSSLRYVWAGESYGWPDPLYLLLNGCVILLALPTAWTCLRLLLTEGRVTGDLLLVAIAGVAVGTGRWLEAAVVVVLSLLASVLKMTAFQMTSRATQAGLGAMGRRPVVIRDGAATREVSLQDVHADDLVVVQQGQMIPVDGLVVAGRAEVREEGLTGESVYQVRIPGQQVLAGGMVESGTVDIRAEKVGEDTLLAHIDHLVSRALKRPTRRESLVDMFARYYVGAILIVGVVVFLVYGQFSFFAEKMTSLEALRRALIVMLAVSPAALVLAGPLVLYAGLLRAGRRGILFKGGDVMEDLAQVSTLLLDKTGTLTYASPQVAAVKTFGDNRADDVLDAALMVERLSSHPIARAICRYGIPLRRNIDIPDKFHEFEGGGACAQKDSRIIKVGALWLMEDGREIAAEVTTWMDSVRAQHYTPVLVADRMHILGGFAMEDAVREDARAIMSKLRSAGIRKLVMVTGDHRETAERVAREVGVDEVEAECMPDKKMKRLARERVGGIKVGMVGDGLNDAPALAAADVGMAMGAMGSDLAIEAAGVALLHNDLGGLYEAVAGSRQTIRAMGRGLGLVVASNFVLLGLALAGWMTLIQGAWLQIVVLALVAGYAAWLYASKP